MGFKRSTIAVIVGLVVWAYTTFVIQALWNWFAVRAFNVPELSYWGTYGLLILVGCFSLSEDREFKDEHRWKIVWTVIGRCVPPNLEEELTADLKDLEEGVWAMVVGKISGKVMANTLALALGWVIHTFLL